MTDMEILQLADQCGVVAVTKHEWDGRQFNHTDDYLDGDAAALVIFAKAIAQRTWVGLTEEDLKILSAEWRIVYGAWMDDFARDIEAKLKEKNT